MVLKVTQPSSELPLFDSQLFAISTIDKNDSYAISIRVSFD